MQITLKLYASLGTYLPESAVKNEAKIEVPEGTTIKKILEDHKVPPQACHLVLLNGHFQPPATRGAVVVKPGDAIAVWPPVAGG